MSARVRWILAVLALAALLVTARVLPVAEWLRAFQGWIAGQGVLGGVLYGLVYALAALLFVPGSLMTIGAGLVFGVLWGTVVVSLASTTAWPRSRSMSAMLIRTKASSSTTSVVRGVAARGSAGPGT